MTVGTVSQSYGDLKSFKVFIGDNDVTAAAVSAHVFQEIFSPTTTAIINFMDTTNLLMTLPIRSGSIIKVEIETDMNCKGDGAQSWEFVIYKIGDKTIGSQGVQEYSIYAADAAFLINQTKRIRKAYKGVKASDIVTNVVKENFGRDCEVDGTDNTMQMIVPGWTPFNTISWLLKTAMKDGAADYAFFQRANGAFAFKSFEVMYSDPAEYSDITFFVAPANAHDAVGDSAFDYSTAIGAYWFEHFDGLSNLAGGYYSSTTATYDFNTKEWKTHSFQFGDDNADDKKALRVDSDFLIAGNEANVSFVPKHTGMFDNASYADTAQEWMASRKSSLLKFDQEKLIIQIAGSAGAADWFGKSCDVDLPSQDALSRDEFDTQRRGRYLITHMAHMINKDTYKINCELVKKRLEEA